MAWAFEGVGTKENTSTDTSVVIPAPSGIQVDDLLVASIHCNHAPTITPPAGWTSAASCNNSSNSKGEVFYKVAVSADTSASDYTFSISLTDGLCGSVSRYSGIDPADPFDVAVGTTSTTSDNEIDCPSITTANDNALIIRHGTIDGAGNATITFSPRNDPPLTERTDMDSDIGTGAEVGGSYCDENQATAGVTGVEIIDCSISEQWCAITAAFNEADVAVSTPPFLTDDMRTGHGKPVAVSCL